VSAIAHLPIPPFARMTPITFDAVDLSLYLPDELRPIELEQTTIPGIAKNPSLLGKIESSVQTVPTKHVLIRGDARKMAEVARNSAHLVVTSPPYWTLKRYEDSSAQMGHIEDYETFLYELSTVWQRCYDVLVPGGRLVCVVGDVCLSRRQNEGRHTVVPLHAAIQEQCRKIGFDNLAPIIWHKISNAAYEVSGGGGFLGKPYEPNSVIKNDIEFVLMLRKPGGYRKPDAAAKLLSVIGSANYQQWFQQIWSGLTGESTKHHPAPYPVQLAERLIRMFSFVGDVVLDPFLGTGTTTVAAAKSGRNSVGYEVQEVYLRSAVSRVRRETETIFRKAEIVEVWSQ
jgi:modification methylase